MIIEIPLFDGGLITNVDPEDIPPIASSDTENFDVDVKGKLLKRQGLESKGTLAGSHLTKLFYWTDSHLTNGAIWVGYEEQNNQIVTFAVNANGTFGAKTALTTLSSSPPSDIQIIPLSNSLRFANGDNNDVGFLQYIDRKFFMHKASPAQGLSYDALKFDSASPTYPSTWELEHVADIVGKNATGTYYYKAVALFDGNQEAQFQDQFFKSKFVDDDKGVHFTLKVDTDDFNPRLTGLNIYRHYAEVDNLAPVYRLIKSVNLVTDSDSPDREDGHSNAHVGNVAYFPGANLSSLISEANTFGNTYGDQESVSVRLGGVNYIVENSMGSTTATYTSTLLKLDSGTLPTATEYWNESATVRLTYRPDSNGNSSFVDKDYSIASCYAGNNVIYDARTSEYWDFTIGEKNNWIATIGAQDLAVLESIKRVLKVNDNVTTTGYDKTVTALHNGYYYEYLSNNEIKIHVFDIGHLDDRTHPLSTTKNKVNYKYGAYVNGRLFAGDVNLDPDDEAEKHNDFIIFSEFNQPDILPVSNYIQIKDSQGGAVMGLRRLGDNLIVFMERGIYQLYAPAGNPAGYSLRESDINIGCVAPNSIVEAGGVIFFASKDNIYVLKAGSQSVPVSTAVKDIYTGSANLDKTVGVYDPLKNRVLFRFGSGGTALYALDYLKILNGQESWNKLTFVAGKSIDTIAIDSDLKVHVTHNET
ncbi:MAG TPA: hypothetical protein EYF95_08120 [Flavobacteriales bacterium]|nr:hypothetical protein [Flavobacteriales bacterium]